MKNPFILLLTIGLASCAAPKKALIIAEAPKTVTPQEVAVVETVTPIAEDDGLRMPDMLKLPDETQLRSSSGESSGDATVIIRPPSE